MSTTKPLNYTEHVNFPESYRYGQYFYRVTLKDGRDLAVWADKILITDTGDLLAISTTFFSNSAENREPSPQRINLGLAKDEWVCFYSASVITGDPVGIDWVESDESASSKK